ncbi:UDP-GlcNAc:betaGal beta-1,3-N-acetylglucosaminyltransferase-like protein 1 isoform X3 [Hippocampus zosterae]|uniref:UDP-GlcNAc:betaGal beta-1,3-N-acetylglucosaminyltransferase-like protein 1 isoform X3 n=1 Tax=Hippocampus zosterae TaxID=109293 RepID=UPI00223DC2E1|nr:UDP-GlcNAc:betaGal beta-1,3-N-acetylglucosaminyltransferase-like protein 1 isoform X3 [Hippocampus zosterae]
MEWPDEVSEVNMKPPKRLRIVPSAAETALEGQEKRQGAVDVSIIMPVYNASCWLDECLQAILDQDFTGTMELSVFDDASTDDSRKVVETWRERLEGRDISLVFSGHNSDQPRGVGYAKNKAVAQSCGKYLCFQDADDIMLPQRVRLQYEASVLHSSSLIGCKVRRLPEGSTQRYTRWINTITQDQLLTQVYTSHGPTVIMPTWFCSRDWFSTVGWFSEESKGVPEDLIFFYQSLRQGGLVIRVDHCLVVYRYHEKATTHSVKDCPSPSRILSAQPTHAIQHFCLEYVQEIPDFSFLSLFLMCFLLCLTCTSSFTNPRSSLSTSIIHLILGSLFQACLLSTQPPQLLDTSSPFATSVDK